MLVITVELWPQGDPARAKRLGSARIVNDGSGDEHAGNYDVTLTTWHDPPRVWKRGRVEGFPRLKLGPFDLLRRALETTLKGRSRSVLMARPARKEGG